MARYHYVLTFQRQTPDGTLHIGTHQNYAHFDGLGEKQMYDHIFDQVAREEGAPDSMAVLFYRLTPDPEAAS